MTNVSNVIFVEFWALVLVFCQRLHSCLSVALPIAGCLCLYLCLPVCSCDLLALPCFTRQLFQLLLLLLGSRIKTAPITGWHSGLSVVCGNLFISRALRLSSCRFVVFLLATKLSGNGRKEWRSEEKRGERKHNMHCHGSHILAGFAKTNWQLNASQSLQISFSKIFQCILHFTPMTFYPQTAASPVRLFPLPTTCACPTKPPTGFSAKALTATSTTITTSPTHSAKSNRLKL